MVNNLKPMIALGLYHTISPSIPEPVNRPLTIKKGTKEIKYAG